MSRSTPRVNITSLSGGVKPAICMTMMAEDGSTTAALFKSKPVRSEEAWVRKGYVLAIVTLLSIFLVSGFIRQMNQATVIAASNNNNLNLNLNPPPVEISNDEEEDSSGHAASLEESIEHDDFNSNDESASALPPQGCDARTAKLKVFMYDLPPKFHYGLIHEFSPSKGQIWPKNVADIPHYPGGLYQQHSPEYWLTSDLLTSSMPDRRSPCTAFRVERWQEADIVFVPFFASLCYNKLSTKLQKPNMDEEVQKQLVKWVKSQPAWQAYQGSNHVVVIHHPNSMAATREQLRHVMFVVADFGRYDMKIANLGKDVVAPYKHVVPTLDTDESSFEERNTLLFFQGAIVRKEGGIIRQQLHEMLSKEDGVKFATGNTQSAGIRSAAAGMRGSKFCLHLAGDTPSSNRLFDAIASGCVPVVISDEVELPFEDVMDYSEFCVFVNATQALRKGFLLKVLRGIGKDEWTRMWGRIRQVQRHFEYRHPTQPGDAVNMVWSAIARKLPALTLKLHKRGRFTRSHATRTTVALDS